MKINLVPKFDSSAKGWYEVTNSSGTAEFNNIPAGIYLLSGSGTNLLELNVHSVGPNSVALDWTANILHTRLAKGEFRFQNGASHDQQVELLNLVGKEISKQALTASGEFDFGQRRPGIYLLHLVSKPKDNDAILDVPIQVDPKATRESLQVAVNYDQCFGAVYAAECIQSNKVILRGLAGTVVDAYGTAIPKAKISFQPDSGTPVRITSNDAGRFSGPQVRGEGKLTIEAAGFQFLDAVVNVDPSATGEALVQLGVRSVCASRISTAEELTKRADRTE